AKVVDDSARRVLGDRRAARVDRDLWRDELFGNAALARVGNSHGVGRGTWTRVGACSWPGNGARRSWRRDWTRGCVWIDSTADESVVRRWRDRPGDVHFGLGAARRDRTL